MSAEAGRPQLPRAAARRRAAHARIQREERCAVRRRRRAMRPFSASVSPRDMFRSRVCQEYTRYYMLPATSRPSKHAGSSLHANLKSHAATAGRRSEVRGERDPSRRGPLRRAFLRERRYGYQHGTAVRVRALTSSLQAIR